MWILGVTAVDLFRRVNSYEDLELKEAFQATMK